MRRWSPGLRGRWSWRYRVLSDSGIECEGAFLRQNSRDEAHFPAPTHCSSLDSMRKGSEKNLKSQIVTSSLVVLTERVEHRIVVIRGQKVLLSTDLAELYEVAPRVLMQAVKRNQERFPA